MTTVSALRRCAAHLLPSVLLALVASSLAGCGHAHARRVQSGSRHNLEVTNATARTVKLYVARTDDAEVAELAGPLADLAPGETGYFRVSTGTFNVYTERRGQGHETHRRFKAHFSQHGVHRLTLGGPS
jgi:hypothetical protein